ncbi:hypothetical protein LTR10_021660 [Elasticomyces elasticus]|uniref:Uncharacterized protein n=1 Tax=Exophiala sideris TaxID=1016849 RepID=A0ABR0J966_9EURO|nr:hypothetical protein LTR10_021660 [Elasticomyces elasticus]KAK5022194.1 hypothetical protein LTS07_010273 [Exophiala sideris]KAK5059028.1 hypothetical protein LTR69_006316 [Exophiala sideris]KAK5182860.1 hypothetical protein LTR44_004569 [Eurotiomycetes sp. CCFEE 6388]
MSLRLALGFIPADLRVHDDERDRCLKREPCTEIKLRQRIICVQYSHTFNKIRQYKVKEIGDQSDGSDAFAPIPADIITPERYCPLKLNHPDWKIKGVISPDLAKGDAARARAARVVKGQVNWSEKYKHDIYMVLLERERPCECHKWWKPKHDLKIVRTPEYEKAADMVRYKAAKKRNRDAGWASSSRYALGAGVNAGMIRIMTRSSAGCDCSSSSCTC